MYRDLIIRYMQKKRDILNNLEEGLGNLYFTKSELEAILQWDEKRVKSVWDRIVEAIDSGEEGINPTICPFCLYHELKCNECEVAENRNGKCISKGSDYMKLIHRLQELEDKLPVYKNLGNETYKRIIKEIIEE